MLSVFGEAYSGMMGVFASRRLNLPLGEQVKIPCCFGWFQKVRMMPSLAVESLSSRYGHGGLFSAGHLPKGPAVDGPPRVSR